MKKKHYEQTKDQGDWTQSEILEHLSVIAEQYGIRYKYVVENNTITALQIDTTESPEPNEAVASFIMALGILAEALFETLNCFNSEEPLLRRNEALHAARMTMEDQIGAKYRHAISRSANKIEIITNIH